MDILAAQKRSLLGKKTRELRVRGILPGVVYGKSGKSMPLELNFSDFLKTWRKSGESLILNLVVNGGKASNVVIHEVSVDRVTGNPMHVDFYEVSADRPIRTHVPIKFVGESPAVKANGGALVKVMHELEIEALPKDLPHEIEVDLSQLAEFESHILLKDIRTPKGVTLQGDLQALVIKVTAPRSEEEVVAATESATVDLESIEVVKKGKKEEEPESPDSE